jgi:polyphosphate kinase
MASPLPSDPPVNQAAEGLSVGPPAASAAVPGQDLESPELYLNRELSLLEFQKRVLDEAKDSANPLLERLKFLSIVSSNLDEFFMVRVAGLLKQVASGSAETGPDGRSAAVQLPMIHQEARRISDETQDLFRSELLPALAQHGIRIVDYSSLREDERQLLDAYFVQQVFPVLTPLAYDPSRPFPHISSRSLNLAVVVADGSGAEQFARIKIPDTLAQLVAVPPSSDGKPEAVSAEVCFVWLDQLIAANLGLLFSGLNVVESYSFRVTRDADVAIQELESDDLLETVEEAIRKRRFSVAVRLQVDFRMPDRILDILTSNLEINTQDVYRVQGPISLARLMQLYSLERPELKDKPFLPRVPVNLAAGEQDIFAEIRREDILLHHPFDSFQPVIAFLQQAARDPDVLAIKMTLYRVGRNSPVVAALLEAIENGKQVAALVELKARFDEESNIEWARTLEAAGVHVVYGMLGFKVHSKIALVVRREEGNTIRRYTHLGTGNYNPVTARLYTDFGFLTSNEQIGEDATYFFNALTGYSRKHRPRKLLVAPVNLREQLRALILREVAVRERAGEGHLILKMNSLEDPEMIRLLYRASQAGVKIDLLVRGFCCLRPGVPGVSENIRVTSIVGRFLEHSRVFYFRNGGSEEIYLGSADLMRRNLDHRVEILFPMENPKLVRRLKEILKIYLTDDAKARRLQPDGQYWRPPRDSRKNAADSQAWLLTDQDRPGKRVNQRPFRGGRRRRNGSTPSSPNG